MGIARITRHLVANRARVNRAFPAAVRTTIEAAVAASEALHGGQIRVVIEGALDGAPLFRGQTAQARAVDVFALQRIWDTAQNNGVLIYLLLADREVEIVADRGIHGHVGGEGWEAICREMEQAFMNRNYEAGVLAGIEAVTRHLAAHFPKMQGGNELSDDVVVL